MPALSSLTALSFQQFLSSGLRLVLYMSLLIVLCGLAEAGLR